MNNKEETSGFVGSTRDGGVAAGARGSSEREMGIPEGASGLHSGMRMQIEIRLLLLEGTHKTSV